MLTKILVSYILVFSTIFTTCVGAVQLKSSISEDKYKQLKEISQINKILIDELNKVLTNKNYTDKMDRTTLFTKSNDKNKMVDLKKELEKIYLLSLTEFYIEKENLDTISLDVRGTDLKLAKSYANTIDTSLKHSPSNLDNFSNVVESILNLLKLKVVKIESLDGNDIYHSYYPNAKLKILHRKTLEGSLLKEVKVLFRMYKTLVNFIDEWGMGASFDYDNLKRQFRFIENYKNKNGNLIFFF